MRTKPEIPKEFNRDSFIEFLSQATPEDLSEVISLKGKPRKPYCPIYIFRDKEDNTND